MEHVYRITVGMKNGGSYTYDYKDLDDALRIARDAWSREDRKMIRIVRYDYDGEEILNVKDGHIVYDRTKEEQNHGQDQMGQSQDVIRNIRL